MLYHDVAKATSKRLVDQLVNAIHTPPRAVTPIPVNIPVSEINQSVHVHVHTTDVHLHTV